MNFNKVFRFLSIMSCLAIFASASPAAVKFNQSNKVNTDGSISITFTYSANTADIKNGMIGDLPFTEELVKEYFSFPSGEVKKVIVFKDKTNPNLSLVTVDVTAKDISKISGAKALSSIKVDPVRVIRVQFFPGLFRHLMRSPTPLILTNSYLPLMDK